jgi:hypothetical protein
MSIWETIIRGSTTATKQTLDKQTESIGDQYDEFARIIEKTQTDQHTNIYTQLTSIHGAFNLLGKLVKASERRQVEKSWI